MYRLWTAGLASLLIAGCGGGGHPAATAKQQAKTFPPRPGDEKVIRGWNKAVDTGDFKRAGSYFAPGAIVIQDYALQLPNQKIAAEWNSGFPCRADITFIRPERVTTLAGFHLREGPKGQCKDGGSARVRFTIRAGLIQRWQQILEPPKKQQTPVPAT
jgi:hypothetical protein